MLVAINSLCIGYFVGRSFNSIKDVQDSESFFKKEKRQKNEKTPVLINESKFVSNIKTDGLEKKYTTLGETQISNDNISSSINKLKNMKG